MFLAGLELDLNEFRKNRLQAILFGFLIFSSSLILGFITSYYFLHYNLKASILIGAMISTYTLVSYPIVSRLGLVRHRVIVLAVGGVILTDMSALIVLVMLKSLALKTDNTYVILQIILSFIGFLIVTMYLFPKIARWYFKKIEEVGTWQFIFILALLFTSAFLAELAGFEPIIGAFAAGLALNSVVPHNSSLSDRISFFGNSIFIPFFLIQVGMILNIGVIFKGYEVIELSVILIMIILFTKWLSAYIIQKTLKYSSNERNFLFGVSSSKAAATIAIVMVGYQVGILDEKILNSSILIVLTTCLISSFFTEYYGRKIAIENDANELLIKPSLSTQRIQISVSRPETIARLIEFGIMIKDPQTTNPIIALTIIQDETQLIQKVSSCQKIISQTAKEISPKSANQIVVTSRIDINVSGGISKAIKENLITDIIIGLNDKNFGRNKIFGNILQNLIEDSNQTVYAVRNNFALNSVDNIWIIMPENIEYEPGFRKSMITLINLSKNISSKLVFYGFRKTINSVQKLIINEHKSSYYSLNVINELKEFHRIDENIGNDDMLVCFLSRLKAISHNLQYEHIVEEMIENVENNNFVVIFPEQNPAFIEEDISHFDILDTSPIQENIARFSLFKEYLRKLLNK
jgi:Kef-type K+ transport system membrane component KefB